MKNYYRAILNWCRKYQNRNEIEKHYTRAEIRENTKFLFYSILEKDCIGLEIIKEGLCYDIDLLHELECIL